LGYDLSPVRDALQATASENQDLMKQSKDLAVVIAKLEALFSPQGPDLFLANVLGERDAIQGEY
jgi:hypothetical protein